MYRGTPHAEIFKRSWIFGWREHVFNYSIDSYMRSKGMKNRIITYEVDVDTDDTIMIVQMPMDLVKCDCCDFQTWTHIRYNVI